VRNKSAPDCEIVNCTPQLLTVTPDQELAPRLGRPQPKPENAGDALDIVVVELSSDWGPLSEEVLQRPREGRPDAGRLAERARSVGAEEA
jgi:hypothetical protein